MEHGIDPSRQLVRAISRWELVGVSVNGVIGSGIYLLPAATAALLGPMSVWAVVLAGGAVALVSFCFAEASSYFDEPGGAYVYTREAFGPFVAFEVGWLTWLARIASVASLANGLALATAYVWPAASSEFGARALLIAFSITLLTWINVIGVKEGARTSVLLVLAKMIPLVLFVLVGLFFVDSSRAIAITSVRAENLSEATLLLLFAYGGFENAPAAAGECKNPRRDVPFALVVTIAIVTAVYTAVQFVAMGTLAGIAEAKAPLAEAAAAFMGRGGAVLMSIGAIVSILGNIANTTLTGPRYAFALAQDGYGPAALARVHAKYRTPAVAIVAQSMIALVLALTGSFVELAMLSVIARLATYMGTAAAVPFLRRKLGGRGNDFQLRGGATIPVLSVLLTLVFIASAEAANLIAGAIAMVVGAVIYAFRGNPRRLG
jgi:amino acid transporter